MKSLAEVEKLVKRFRIKPTLKMSEKTLTDALNAQEETKKIESAAIQPNIWRIIMRSRMIRIASVVVLIAIFGATFAAGYAYGTGAMRSAGALVSSDISAIKKVINKYVTAARKQDTKAMFELSDPQWRSQHEVGELTRADKYIAASEIEIGDISTIWREKPEVNVAIFRQGGVGGMALAFFVLREQGSWVINRSRQGAEEARVDRWMEQGADLCDELIRAHKAVYEKEGTIMVSYGDLTTNQRKTLKWLFGIVDELGNQTEFGQQLNDLEHSKIRLDRGGGDKVVIHLLTPNDDHFLAFHLGEVD